MVVHKPEAGVIGGRGVGESYVRRVAVHGCVAQEIARHREVVTESRQSQVLGRRVEQVAEAVTQRVEAPDAELRIAQVLRPCAGDRDKLIRTGREVEVRHVAGVLQPDVRQGLLRAVGAGLLIAAGSAGGRQRRHPDPLAWRPDLREGRAKEVRIERPQAIGGVPAHRVTADRHAVSVQREVARNVVPHLEDVVLPVIQVPAVRAA